MSDVDVVCESTEQAAAAAACAESLGVVLNRDSGAPYQLLFDHRGVCLRSAAGQHGDVAVDFCAGGAAHRRRFGGGNGQMIAKAVGVSAQVKPRVFDATAGLGGDAFVLACLGCSVVMMERSPVAYALLDDGLRRARIQAEAADPELAGILQRMRLLPGDSIAYLQASAPWVADVIYLDPMFPERRKSAAVKKEMQAFHQAIGQDLDEAPLLAAALDKAEFRVAIKRPRQAPFLAGRKPHFSLEGKSSRYDVFVAKSLDRHGRGGPETPVR